VKVLRAELLRVCPDADLSGVVEKDELCRLLHEARGRSADAGPAEGAIAQPAKRRQARLEVLALLPTQVLKILGQR